jgi:bis(5'-adenosyl)-triphosphatase
VARSDEWVTTKTKLDEISFGVLVFLERSPHSMLRASWSLRRVAASSGLARRPRPGLRAMSRPASASALDSGMRFGPIAIPASQIFAETSLSVGLVNLKPVVPGHVLIVSKRVVPRFHDLTDDETADLWSLAKRVGHALEGRVGATSVTFALQDGPQAGQTVPHVHVHVLPRVAGDFADNDDIYREVEASGEREGERSADADGHAARDATRETQKTKGRRFDPDAERVARSAAEMAAEAAELRPLF